MDKLSAESLQTVGAVTLHYLAEQRPSMRRLLLLALAAALGIGRGRIPDDILFFPTLARACRQAR